MSLVGLLILVFILLAIFGNPIVGPRVYQGYSYGWAPGGVGLILVIVLVVLLLGGRL
jgi:hypothetical protein